MYIFCLFVAIYVIYAMLSIYFVAFTLVCALHIALEVPRTP